MSSPDTAQLLEAGTAELGVAINAQQRIQLLLLLAEVADWNTRVNLTAITEPTAMVRKHLLDSLSIQPHLRGRSIADVGTGAGFPGLPLAICNPDRAFTLIEATAKKARFLEYIVSRLSLGNVTVVNARAEAYKPPRPFDSVVARALGKLGDIVRFAGHLCARDGRILAMKGRLDPKELRAVPRNWRIVATHRLNVPGLEAERHVVELARQ